MRGTTSKRSRPQRREHRTCRYVRSRQKTPANLQTQTSRLRNFRLMESRIDIWATIKDYLVMLRRLTGYAAIIVFQLLRPKASLVTENLALRSQLAMCKDAISRKKAPGPKSDRAFRLLWAIISKVHCGWESLACLMQPATVKRW